MSKIIAVYGSPGAGTTTFALKLAQHIYHLSGGNMPVVYLSSDVRIPALSYIFPNRNSADISSLGEALDSTDIRLERILEHMATRRDMPNMGYLGYKGGENRYSYPRITEDKAAAFFFCLRQMTGTFVIDCSNDPSDILSLRAMAVCDHAFRIVNPDLKSIGYFASLVDAEPSVNKRITVLNETDSDVYRPLEEFRDHFRADYVLPFNPELKQQSASGRLSERPTQKKYCKVLAEIVKKVE